MEKESSAILSRNVEAALVPAGTRVVLKQGETARITQSLGGSWTVVVNGNLFRVEAKDGDALGFQIVAGSEKATGAARTADLVEREVWNQLKTCFDPEIPVNIVDLGLVYGCELTPSAKPGSYRVEVKMTLTAPGCGMGPTLAEDVRQKLMSIAEVDDARVELVWEPAWNQEMLSETARLKLGIY